MSALCWTRQTPPLIFSGIQVPWPVVCVFEPLESARRKEKKERRGGGGVVFWGFSDTLSLEGDRLFLLASAKVQTLKKDYEKQKVAGIKEICFGVK